MDGTIDYHGRPALKEKTGRWTAGTIILVNQGLVTLAFFGVGVNLVLYLTRVLQQGNAEAANNVSKWTGTVYIFSLVGAFLSDSYWGRYKTCAIFQAIFVLGLGGVSVASSMFLITLKMWHVTTACGKHSQPVELACFISRIYMVALGFGWRYRHFKPSGNPLNRFCQVFVAASKKWSVKLPEGKECLFEDDKESSPTTGRKILHTHEFKFLDKAAFITSRDFNDPKEEEPQTRVDFMPHFTGAAMRSTISGFQIPASSMSSFDILSVALFIFLYRRVLGPLVLMFKKKDSKGQLEFFNAQAPDALKSFGSALCMTSISLGNYVSSFIVTIVMNDIKEDDMPGWIPGNSLNGVHSGQLEGKNDEENDSDESEVLEM
ncbi:NRT1/ PTR family protein 7.3 [Tanacetum coccineum]